MAGEDVTVWGRGYMRTLHLPLSFAVNLSFSKKSYQKPPKSPPNRSVPIFSPGGLEAGGPMRSVLFL